MSDDAQKGNGPPEYWAGVRQGRMMTRIDACCCTFDESGNGPLDVCGAHREWLDAALDVEREACAKIADAHVAQHEGKSYPPGVLQAVQLEGRCIADAIRARSNT